MSSNNGSNSANRTRSEIDTDRRGNKRDTDRRGDDRGTRDTSADSAHRGDDHADRENRDTRGDNENSTGDSSNPLSALIALLGVWMIVAALVMDVVGAHFWSDVLVGALLVAVGGYTYSRQADDRMGNSAVALIAVAAGLWLIAAPYVLGGDAGLTAQAYELWFYNHIAVGLLAVGLGAYSGLRTRGHQDDPSRTNA